jgi:hypothetical protein
MTTCTAQRVTFGLQAEGWIIQFLSEAGYQVKKSTVLDDKERKIDFWVQYKAYWVAVQFTVDHDAIINGKGIDALKRGICPSWLNGQEMEKAIGNHPEVRQRLLTQFWNQVSRAVAARPELLVRNPTAVALKSQFAYSCI